MVLFRIGSRDDVEMWERMVTEFEVLAEMMEVLLVTMTVSSQCSTPGSEVRS